ncbi:MAG: hypothetical protein ACJ8I9_08295 [Chthoniobacterales bacterium]|jgi:hypothetical protein
MAADFIINAEHQVVFSYGWDTLTRTDLTEHRSRLFHDAKFDPRLRQIANLTDVGEMKFSSDEIWSLAREPVLAPPSPRAVVAGEEQYGLARVFHGYSNNQNVRVFRELKEATDWLDVPIEVAVRAFNEIRQMHGLS